MTELTFTQLTPAQQELLNAAEVAMQNAYNPGSGFVVGAAVRTKSGKIYPGANIKLSATGMVACAETAAFLTANTNGDREFISIAVIARHGDKAVQEPNYPCGRCCQSIHEFSQLAGKEIEMIYSNTNKDRIVVAPISAFLPMPFVSGIFKDQT